jgi:hypothetical protein
VYTHIHTHAHAYIYIYIYIYIRACTYSACIRLITRKHVRARAHAYTHKRMHARTKTALKKKNLLARACPCLPVRETPHLDVPVAAADKHGAISANVYGIDTINIIGYIINIMGFSNRELAHTVVPAPHLEGPATIAAYNDCAVA